MVKSKVCLLPYQLIGSDAVQLQCLLVERGFNEEMQNQQQQQETELIAEEEGTIELKRTL